MKRSPLKRRKRLERRRRQDDSLPPKPRPALKRAKKRKAIHQAKRRTPAELEEQRRKIYGGPTGDHDSFVRAMGCVLSLIECAGPVEAHHVTRISQGGIWSDQVGLCRAHHTGWGGRGGNGLAFPIHYGVKTFAKRYPTDLIARAAGLVQRHYPEGVPDGR